MLGFVSGKTITFARTVDIPRAVYNLRFFASSILHHTTECTEMASMGCVHYTSREPVGVGTMLLKPRKLGSACLRQLGEDFFFLKLAFIVSWPRAKHDLAARSGATPCKFSYDTLSWKCSSSSQRQHLSRGTGGFEPGSCSDGPLDAALASQSAWAHFTSDEVARTPLLILYD